MQVEGNEPAAPFVHHPAVPAPGGITAQPGHASRQQPPVLPALVQVLDPLILRPEPQHLRDHELNLMFRRCFSQTGDVHGVQGYRLFTQHVYAPLHRLFGVLGMQIGGQADIQNIQRFLVQHVVEALVMVLIGVFFHLLGPDIAERHEFGIFHTVPRGYMCAADAPDADQSDRQHTFPPP